MAFCNALDREDNFDIYDAVASGADAGVARELRPLPTTEARPFQKQAQSHEYRAHSVCIASMRCAGISNTSTENVVMSLLQSTFIANSVYQLQQPVAYSTAHASKTIS